MANDDIKKELEALRAEVATLAAARQQEREPVEPAPKAAADEKSTSTVGLPEGVMGHVEELIGLLEREFKETPVISGIAIFGIGVLVGRFLR